MLISQAVVTALYGVVLTLLTIVWLGRHGVRLRGTLRAVVLFLCLPFLMVPAGFVAGVLHLSAPLPIEIWSVPVEEALKLGLIARLGISGRPAIGIGLLFGCVEIVSSKAILALVLPLPMLPVWMAMVTGVVLMHGATGLVYSAIGHIRRRYLFLFATLLHLLNNLGAFWIEHRSATALKGLAMQMSMIAALGAAAFLFADWARGRRIATVPVNDRDGLAGRAPFV